MANCKVCGEWFSSTNPDNLCPACQRALKRLNGYAAPVRHGQWIARALVNGQVYCSECGTIEKNTDGNYKSRRCPNCGAKMDLEG